MRTSTDINSYLDGNFAPVKEERDDDDLAVTGAIPPELQGLLLRNGPNPIVAPDSAMYNWFRGDGMLHGIELSEGRARYRNRWVRTPSACDSLGEAAPSGPAEVGWAPSVANTSVVAHAGRIYALVESGMPTEVRADLSTVGGYDFTGKLTGPVTAHPKIDPTSGEMLFFGYNIVTEPYINFHVADASGVLVRSQPVDIPRPIMMHTFGVTATRIVWLDLPVVFDASLIGRQPFPWTWRPEHGARVGIMSRNDQFAEVTWIDIEPCYVFHEMNAFDDDNGNVVIDVVAYPDMYVTDVYGPGSTRARLERWSIDPNARRVTTEVVDDASQEFPRINDRYQGRPYQYGYTAEIDIGPTWFRTGDLRKHDLTTGHVERHPVGPGRAASEPVFVASRRGGSEDAGWILSVVYDAERNGSDVIIVDATDFEAPPVATIHLPRRVPFGFHGSWIPNKSLS
jgi:carotenoid cleavage oxygenase